MNNSIGSATSMLLNQEYASALSEKTGLQKADSPKSLEPTMRKSEIEKIASDFESMFVSLMLKEMRNTLDSEGGGLFAGEGSDSYGGMFDMFMGQHLAEAKPLGIADAIETYLNRALAESTEA
ncbi:MAG: rod-binding protein [Planctomycetota bacterium]